MISRIHNTMLVTAVAAGMATLVACQGGGSAPELEDPGAQIAQVGVQMSLTLVATDPEGDELDFAFDSTIPDVQSRATITRSPKGNAIWRWTPLASDVGTWYVDFDVSDGDNTTTLTVEIDVRSAVGGQGAPIFREPLGTGTTLDTAMAECLDLDIVVEDQDSTSVVITQEEPVIEGATVESSGGLTGSWHWCPSAAQLAADDDRFTLTLGADDLSNPKTLKTYLVVLRKEGHPDCPGEAPVITHTAMNANTVGDLTIDATVSDDQGLKDAPLFYYSTSDPGATPNLGAMTQASMIKISGTMQNGVWAADVPNPAAAGASEDLYYVVVADDDDDDMGACDHTTTSQVYHMTVTNPGGAGTTGLCEPCSNDAQCGNDGDLCVRVGAAQSSYCLEECTTSADCDTGYTCSATAVTSVGGQMAKQCVPDSGSCTMTVSCIDDDWEENDTRAQAHVNPYLPANDLYDLTSCPLTTGSGDDEDFFEISITQDSNVLVEIAGGTATDLDLALQRQDGTVVVSDTSLDSNESVTTCLTPGDYYVRVYSWGTAENDYILSYERTNQSCAAVCTDDSAEPDNDAANARYVEYPTDTFSNQKICATDDWYEVMLLNGEHLTVDLTFTQTTSNQDLDLHLINGNGTDLTYCVESNPSTCTTADGQSADSDEHYEYTAPQSGCTSGCPYYVVVHGWNGSTNTYGITIGIE